VTKKHWQQHSHINVLSRSTYRTTDISKGQIFKKNQLLLRPGTASHRKKLGIFTVHITN